MSVKYISLLALAFQNAALILTMRQSRATSGPRYLSSTAVVLSETIKALTSLIIVIATSIYRSRKVTSSDNDSSVENTKQTLPSIWSHIIDGDDLVRIAIPAILYTVQNNLQYAAASHLDAATFAVLYQGKILTTAMFAVLLLRQILSGYKWLALLLLTCGIVLVSYPSKVIASPSFTGSQENRMLGILAVLSACVVSGFTGVFVEMIFKKAKNSQHSTVVSQFWVRNVQLGTASIIISSGVVFVMDRHQVFEHGFFYGYNNLVWSTILLQAIGGLIVSVVVAYADNILKGFATSLSLIASTCISAMIGDTVLNVKFLLGAGLVLVATNVYVTCGEQQKPLEEEASHDQDILQGLMEEVETGYSATDVKDEKLGA